ncbi:hypothetical protein FRC10_010198 [Ceratobasidium sp. 414]|nr:hypothetical protein FRC10_010198 [Ceratobasidium sp. 414]
MPAHNPLVSGGLSFRKFRGTVLNDIWPELLFFTGIATMVCCVCKYTSTNLAFNPQLLTVLGTVLGLVISFRTTSAYDRYWEGRKLWSVISLSIQSRNLANLIWIHVPTDRSAKSPTPLPKDAKLKVVIEKKSMIHLIQAFSVSVKHYLRGEPGIYYQDLYPLIAFLPQYAIKDAPMDSQEKLPLWADDSNAGGHHIPRNPASDDGGFKRKKGKTFDPEQALPDVTPDHVHLAPARNPPTSGFFDYFPIFMPFKAIYKLVKRMFQKDEEEDDAERSAWTGKKVHRPLVESIVPLEIALHLSSYYNFLLTSGLLQAAAATAFNNNLHSLQDASVQLRRIATTPIPFAYQAHLRMAIWLYLFFLPFQIYTALRWVTIPATLFAAFLFLGFLEIGAEIENPFNYDDNDLDIDGYCLSIGRELAEIMAHDASPPSTYIFSEFNQPFAPADRRTASELLSSEPSEYHDEVNGMENVRATLVRNWRSVNEMTTHHKKNKIAA